jgi:alkylated DNA repair protein (DNA oxidative demethylase)
MTLQLFDNSTEERLGPGTVVIREFAENLDLLADLKQVVLQARFRHMVTPGGFEMSVAMTNCGTFGWITDRAGYRYDRIDPLSGKPWPAMPASFLSLATRAAARAEYPDFVPDACLINRYQPGAKLSLHQDKDERDYAHPIVSVSLGLPAVFQFGGMQRKDKTIRVTLNHGDVMVWGGPDRLRFHGVLPITQGVHWVLGQNRINLTFRRAG